MNAYDFDNTIFDGDSTTKFYLFCLKRHKRIAFLCAPSLLCAVLKYFAAKKITKTQFKEIMYRFLRYCDCKRDVHDFWEKNRKRIKGFYLEQKRPDDVIISASPVFLLSPICKELGVGTLIASNVDPKTGIYSGENCHGEEKVRRFREVFGEEAVIEEFYSDSRNDTPMAKEAKKAYMVKGEEITEWFANGEQP